MVDSVADWLAHLDLAQYARAFADNHIEPHVLADLTDADLRELGLQSLGHRRTQGFDTADLEDAKTLLEQLA